MPSVILSILQSVRVSLRARAALEVEIVALRHQLHVLQRSRRRLTQADRLLWAWLSRVWPPLAGSRRLPVGSTERPAIAGHISGLSARVLGGTERSREIWPEFASQGQVPQRRIEFDSRRLHHLTCSTERSSRSR
jgi:hypothetical protein